jgi:hypothetical protein
MMRTYTIPEIAKELKIHPDTLYKAKRNKAISKRLAKKLEDLTGIQRLRWLYPDDYGDHWNIIT